MKLLKFYANWCIPCKSQSKILKDLQGIEIQDVDIESDENEDLVEKYNIRNLPTMVVLDDSDNVLHRFNGLTSLITIENTLKDLKK